MLRDTATAAASHWIFAYGSLMWHPDFPVAERALARADGWARSFCLRSICHRGTAERPGLVLGLDADPDASCPGIALRVADEDWTEVIAAVRARELVTEAYAEAVIPLDLDDGRRINAIAYVMRREHWQYAGGLPADEQAAIIAAAHGGRGSNADYLFNTVAHLQTLGIPDPVLTALADQVGGLLGGSTEYASANRPR